MEQVYIYAVFSATEYKIGKAIRKVTAEPHNHISLALDRELTQMYGFSRRYCRLPLYGGFVREYRSRFCYRGTPARIKLCRIPVTPEQHRQLEEMLQTMHEHSQRYIYNHISALAALIHLPVPARDAYTCAEFAVEALSQVGVAVTPGKFYSIGQLEKLLEPFCIYEGPIPQPEEYDEAFFARRPVPFPLLTTTRELLKLIPRILTYKTAP